jgi:sec-independent protein translocase protein TatA
MFGLGFGELVVILLIVVLIFGAGKLPQLGDALGRSIRNFKSAATGDEARTQAASRDAQSKDDANKRS